MTPSGGPADRAAEVIRRRAARVGGWTDITDRAVSRVRAVGVRTWPLDAVFPTDAGPRERPVAICPLSPAGGG